MGYDLSQQYSSAVGAQFKLEWLSSIAVGMIVTHLEYLSIYDIQSRSFPKLWKLGICTFYFLAVQLDEEFAWEKKLDFLGWGMDQK